MAERAHPEDPGFKNKFFGLVKSHYKKKLYQRYNFCNKFIKNKVVLDIPCGLGWGTSLLKGAKHITGIDISEQAIEYARKHYEKKNRKFDVSGMQEIPLENGSVEVIICLEGFEHVPRDIGSKFINQSKKVLKLEGLLIITCPILNEYNETTGNPYHLCEYPEEELLDIFNKNFRVLSLERIKGPDGPEYKAVLLNIKKNVKDG